MGGGGPCFGGGAPANDGATGDKRGFIGQQRLIQRRPYGGGIMTIHRQRVPAAGAKTGNMVIRTAKIRISINRNMIIIKQNRELTQPQVPRKGKGFLTHALHQTPITCHDKGAVGNDVFAQFRTHHMFRDGHANSIA